MATCINEMKLTIPSKSSNESYARAVSYTHLDVYKRQSLDHSKPR